MARHFMPMRDGGWHVLDARQSEDALYAQARLRLTCVPVLVESPLLLESSSGSAEACVEHHCMSCCD